MMGTFSIIVVRTFASSPFSPHPIGVGILLETQGGFQLIDEFTHPTFVRISDAPSINFKLSSGYPRTRILLELG